MICLRHLVAAAALVIPSLSWAMPITFDFEELGATGAITSTSSTQGGLTATISRSGASFQIGSIGVGAFGDRTISPFIGGTGATAFVIDFSSAIISASMDIGDFLPSDLDTVQLFAWSGLGGTGTLLDSFSLSCCGAGSGFEFITATVSAAGIRSLTLLAGSSSFPQSMYWDNLIVDTADRVTVPEPGTLLLFGLGLVGLVGLRGRVRL